MFLRLVFRLLEIVAFFWLIRLLIGNLIGAGRRGQAFNPFQPGAHSQPHSPSPAEPRVITGEMKKDPQCGTYVSTELSFKTRLGNEVLHFCSRRCQEEFLEAHSSKRA